MDYRWTTNTTKFVLLLRMSKYKFLFQETYASGKTFALTITTDLSNTKLWKYILEDEERDMGAVATEDIDLSKYDVSKPSSDPKVWCNLMFEDVFKGGPAEVKEEGAPAEGDDAKSLDKNGPEDVKFFFTKA